MFKALIQIWNKLIIGMDTSFGGHHIIAPHLKNNHLSMTPIYLFLQIAFDIYKWNVFKQYALIL